MCFKVQCSKCGKFTWKGCGQHAAEVMASIPPDQRCTCPREGGRCPLGALKVSAAPVEHSVCWTCSQTFSSCHPVYKQMKPEF